MRFSCIIVSMKEILLATLLNVGAAHAEAPASTDLSSVQNEIGLQVNASCSVRNPSWEQTPELQLAVEDVVRILRNRGNTENPIDRLSEENKTKLNYLLDVARRIIDGTRWVSENEKKVRPYLFREKEDFSGISDILFHVSWEDLKGVKADPNFDKLTAEQKRVLEEWISGKGPLVLAIKSYAKALDECQPNNSSSDTQSIWPSSREEKFQIYLDYEGDYGKYMKEKLPG